MTSTELREKLDKAIEAVEKKRVTLARHEKRLEKLYGIIAASGYTAEEIKTWKWADDPKKNNLIWKTFDIIHCQEDIENTRKVIVEKERIVEKWSGKLAEAEDRENLINNQFPEVLRGFQEEVVQEWNLWDYRYQEFLKKEYSKLGYSEFIKKYSYNDYQTMHKTAAEFHRENVRAAEALCINLWNRVKEIVGEATDWSGLFVTNGNELEGCVVNGFVIGTEGTAEVRSIGAGGYNIQRWHIRTLVNKVK